MKGDDGNLYTALDIAQLLGNQDITDIIKQQLSDTHHRQILAVQTKIMMIMIFTSIPTQV